MSKHVDDVYWNRYRERSLAETAHHMRVRKRADVDNKTAEAAGDNSEPPTKEVE